MFWGSEPRSLYLHGKHFLTKPSPSLWHPSLTKQMYGKVGMPVCDSVTPGQVFLPQKILGRQLEMKGRPRGLYIRGLIGMPGL